MARSATPRATWIALLVTLSGWVAACGDASAPGATLGVLTAFPAELAAVLERTAVEETRTADGRLFRVGRMGGKRVVVGMTGVGLVNAEATTRALLDDFDVAGVVVCGVAGSPLQIGDVTVAEEWHHDDGSRHAAHRPWLDLAAAMARDGEVALQHCALIPEFVPVPGAAPGDLVCFPHRSRVVVGGFASSSDSFGGAPFRCLPTEDDVFACDTDAPGAFVPVSVGPDTVAELARVGPQERVAYDMETSAIAREATARGVPFVAFRASSDGGPDPLGFDEGFVQFFAYYRLAAHNAAVATAAFVERVRLPAP